jgi:glycosyltransferase involved in cell wall biosynthesis
MVLTVYALVSFVLWIGTCIYLLLSSRRIGYLKDVAPALGRTPPSVAIIIAVRNEEAEVEEALRSVCNLQYPLLRIIVINDRSTDGTGAILRQLASENPALEILTISALPPGWLGKNHALYQGYLSSTEEWLLFTDADIKYAKGTVQKAMHFVLQQELDHLAVLPQITSRSWLFRSVAATFAVMLELKLRPWDVRKPGSNASVGVGAFNLVKRSAYEKAGTHTAISLRPDDDLKLGERIKKAGLRQDVLYGGQEIWLAWYTSLGEFIKGLMKNTFSVANYNIFLAIGMALATFFIVVLPLPLLLLMPYPFPLVGVALLLLQVVVMIFKRGIEGQWWYALLIPFAGLVMTYIILQSALLTIRQGGIYWRDSFYSLAELKKQA